MERPDDVPESVWAIAVEAGSAERSFLGVAIARAIMAAVAGERERAEQERQGRRRAERTNRIAKRPTDFDDLTVRTQNICRDLGIACKEDLSRFSDAEILEHPSCGRKSLAELRVWEAGE